MADPEEEKKVRRPISFRLRPVDRKRFMILAAARGLTPGQLARQIVARDQDLILKSSTDRRRIANGEVLRQVLGALGRISDDLGQWANRSEGHHHDNDLFRKLAQMRADVDKALTAIMVAVSGSAR